MLDHEGVFEPGMLEGVQVEGGAEHYLDLHVHLWMGGTMYTCQKNVFKPSCRAKEDFSLIDHS